MKQLKKVFSSVDAIIWFILAFLIVAMIAVPNFATMNNFKNILSQSCVLLTVACGVHFAVLNGGVDFSSTSIIALSSVVGASIMSETSGYLAGKWYAIPVALLAMLALGAVFGIVNGIAVTVFKMPSFIATMATQLIGTGIAVIYSSGKTIGGLPDSFADFGGCTLFGIIPNLLLLALAVMLISHIICSRTLYGRRLYSVGTNPKAALISGIPVKKTIFWIFILSGLCSAVAGIIMMGQMQSGASSYGATLFNDIMGSIIVGGTSPAGGSGKIPNTVLGAVLIILINIALNLLNTPYFIITMIKGLIILFAAAIEVFRKRKERA